MAVSKKPSKPISPTSTLHPPYLQMIGEAISSLKARTGSSQPAIAKFIEDKYNSLLPPTFKKILSVQLKKFVKSEKLVKVKNSYKISASEKVNLVAATIKGSQKKNDVRKANPIGHAPKKAAAKKKGEKTKRLSQVKTPEDLKKNLGAKKASKDATKMKRLSQVKTPEAMKKKKVYTSAKRNASKSVKSSRPALKKAKI